MRCLARRVNGHRRGGHGLLKAHEIAVIAGADAGHALPAIGVAAALVRRGHRVQLLTSAEHGETAQRHGVQVTPLPPLPPLSPPPTSLSSPTSREQDHGEVGDLLWGRAPDMARLLAACLRSPRPGVIVCDSLLPAGGLAAQLLGVPWVELIPHHLPDPAADLPPVGLGRRRARSPLRRADDRRIYRAQCRSIALGDAQASAAARRLGLDGVVAPTVRLVATLPALERPRGQWPPTAHVVGALAVDPALAELGVPAGSDPLVVVTDSTAASVERSIGVIAADALSDLPIRVAITSGSMEPRADQRMVVGRGPHGPLLADARLAVGPGGGGFLSKVTAAGVPMVVVPLAGDQREAAARLKDTRAGRTLAPPWLSGRSLRWAVLRHLADRPARRAAAQLQMQAAALGADLAARLVEQVAAGGQPTARGPDQHLVATLST